MYTFRLEKRGINLTKNHDKHDCIEFHFVSDSVESLHRVTLNEKRNAQHKERHIAQYYGFKMTLKLWFSIFCMNVHHF